MAVQQNARAPCDSELPPAHQNRLRLSLFLWNECMLEIRGSYSKNEDSETLKVLAQFDGGVLHVWHQSDPFYHLLSCYDFSIAVSQTGRTGSVKLKNGGWIETDDMANLKLIEEKLGSFNRMKTTKWLKSREALLVLALLSAFFAIWFLVHKGS